MAVDRPPEEPLPQAYQQNLLCLLITSDAYCRVVAATVPEAAYEGELRTFAHHAIVYIRKYGKPPKDHIVDLLTDVLDDKHNRKRGLYRQILSDVFNLEKTINAEHTVKSAGDFVLNQQLRAAVYDCADLLSRGGKRDDVEERLNKVLRAKNEGFSPGIYLSDKKALDFLDRLESDYVKTGIKQVDKRGACPTRKELMIFMAPPNRGKSWFLDMMAEQGLQQRWKVCIITLEMSQDRKLQRMFQSLFSITKRLEDVEVTRFKYDKMDRLLGFEKDIVSPEHSLADPDIRRYLRKQQREYGLRFKRLVIKEFPSGSLTIQGLRNYLDNLEIICNFVPDLLVVDYGQLLWTDPRDHRISLGRNYVELRGLSQERNMAVLTAHQTNRPGSTAKRVDHAHAAEDFSIVGTADTILTYSQSEREEKRHLARLYADKVRNDAARWTVLISQAYAMGQFIMDSAEMDERYWKLIDPKGANDDAEDEDEERPVRKKRKRR